MRLSDHAIDNYVKRVLKLREGQDGDGIRQFAVEQIAKAYNDPEVVYRDGVESEETPIYIRNGCAFPVIQDEDEKVIPTVYNSGVYLSKLDDYDKEHDEGKATV